MKFVSAFDSYNLCLTGNVGRTLATPSGGLNEHIPIIIMNDQGGGVMNVSDSDDGSMYTLNTIEQHSVCYSVDCRNMYVNKEISGTLQSKNEGGHSLNFINPICYTVENHPNCEQGGADR